MLDFRISVSFFVRRCEKMNFHETGYGRKFFDVQLPKLIQEMGRLADALEENNRRLMEEGDKENADKDFR